MSVVFLRESASSSWVGAGSFLCCAHHSRTFLRTFSETYGVVSVRAARPEWWKVGQLTFMIGIGSSPGAPRSSIMFLMSMERSATLRSATNSQSLLRKHR